MSFHQYAALAGLACMAAIAAPSPAHAQGAALTLQDALARALADDPGVSAAGEARRAAAAGLAQAGRIPNPSLDVLIENVEGSGPYRSDERAERTYSLSQPIELGGDRSARIAVAQSDLEAAGAGARIRRLDLMQDVELAFIDAQAAAASAAVAEERLVVMRELTGAVDRRVRAARDPIMAGERAQARLAETEIEVESARRSAAAARAKLASYWGGDPGFAIDSASFEHAGAPLPGASNAPDVALAEIESRRAEARVDLERARRIPDPTFQAGFREFTETDETALVFGFSMPLQIWDRNGAAVSRARSERARAGFEVESRRRAIQRETSMLQSQAEIARAEISGLDARAIPHGEAALARAREGYAQGGFSYLDVLEAQRALTDARHRRISALRTFHRARALLARLTGAHLDTTPAEEPQR